MSNILNRKSDASLVKFDPQSRAISTDMTTVLGLIESIPDMETEDVVNLYQFSANIDKAAFVTRGYAVSDLVNRAKEDGQEFLNGVKDAGESTILKELTDVLGAEYTTLFEDLKIVDELGADIMQSLSDAPETILPREYYVLATRTKLPMATLDYFREQRDSLTYSTSHARRDTKKLKDGMTIPTVRKEDEQTRKLAVKQGKKESAIVHDSTSKAKKAMIIKVDGTYANEWYLNEIIKKHKSFNKWYASRAKEEFGAAPRKPKAKAKAESKTKAKSKKTTRAKGTAKAKAPARAKTKAKRSKASA